MMPAMTSPRPLTGCIAAVLVAFMVACAGLTTGREDEIGKGAAQQVEQEMGLVRDPELVAYVQAIGSRMAALSPRQDVSYTFNVVDMAEANAFALPGGYIYVSRGLLAIANTEDELACVIGHEIGHVAARHHARHQARAQRVGVASALGTLAAAVLGGAEVANVVGQLGQTAGAGYLAAHGRDQEHESDEIGQTLAAKAGWNPAAMASFLNTLGRETTLQLGQERMPSFLDTHPSTPERVAATKARAAALTQAPTQPIARDRAAFLAKLDGLVVDEDPAGGVFDGQVFRQPVMNFRITFPSDWRTANSAQAVAAVAPDQSGMIQLDLAGTGSDPRAAAQKALSGGKVPVVEHGPLSIGTLQAYQARLSQQTQQGQMGGLFTWISHGGHVYRVQCISPEERFERFAPVCAKTLKSFRPLDAADRKQISAHVLRVASPRAGESLAAFGARTGNVWSPAQTEVANAMASASAFPPDGRLKIAVAVPYRAPSGAR
jgi:predicted Zn-dependent protease